jgi:catechol 2,3-dioxygenase-like lactoylglutathione lyase family enzyme
LREVNVICKGGLELCKSGSHHMHIWDPTGMLLYLTFGSNDLARSRLFYDAALAPLGLACKSANDDEIGYGPVGVEPAARQCCLWLVRPFLKLPATWGNGTLLAFAAKTRARVDAFHQAALAHGGFDEGAPGLRPYHASFYASYVRDPDGNKLSAVCET